MTLTIGVDVGGTTIKAGLVDAEGRVLGGRAVPTPGDRDQLYRAIHALVDDLRTPVPGPSRSETVVPEVSAVGAAVAGFVAADRRHVLFAPHLPWRDEPVAERLAELLELPVLLEHDANAAAVAEHRHGAGRGVGVLVLVALGTGIGGALLIDGRVFRGAHGVAPELGHLCVEPGGRACPCGGRGCWERYCGGSALSLDARELGLGPLTGLEVARAAVEGDRLAAQVFSRLSTRLVDGLALVADVFDPEVIVIGGAVAGSAGLFLADARNRLNTMITGAGHRTPPRLVTAELSVEAGVIGAAVLARESHRAA